MSFDGDPPLRDSSTPADPAPAEGAGADPSRRAPLRAAATPGTEDSSTQAAETTAGEPDQPSPLWLRPGDQVVLAAVSALCLILMAWYLARLSGWGRGPIELRHLPQRQVEYRIDINTADWVEFSQLPRIGRTLAERIVEDREANGPFSSIDDLKRVRGIGAKTVARIREYLAARPAKR